ncbi:MAG: hypothetical protein IJQ54_05285 [Kiritimatiellae bacterium]|nr:hypothetical protein [Kiritimatiellia bacterium]
MAEENVTPVAGKEPPPANPLAKPRASTLKLKPVIRKPTIGATALGKPGIRPGMKLPTQPPAAKSAPAAAPAPEQQGGGAMEQLKSVTQKLKGVTQEIPQQAILRKTGIIADQDLTEAQKQASKSRTARISLSDALGVAPVQNEAAPIKTIRIKRPDSIAKPAAAAPAAAPAPAAEPAAEQPSQHAAEAPSPTLTQRKTLKIARPGAVRPSGKFGIKKPSTSATTVVSSHPAAEGGDVADIPDIPDMPAAAPAAAASAAAPVPANAVPSLSTGATITGIVFQLAACVVIGALGYFLFLDAQLPLFCGGCGWGQ